MNNTALPIPHTRYDCFTRALHWIVAVGIIYTLIVGYALHFIDNKNVYHFFSVLNMSMGTIITPLMIVRLIWRFFRSEVPYPAEISRRHKSIAMLMHKLFYLVIFVVLISGFLMLEHGYTLFWIIPIPQPVTNLAVNHFFFMVHRACCFALTVMIALHIAAVIKHQLLDKNKILARMW